MIQSLKKICSSMRVVLLVPAVVASTAPGIASNAFAAPLSAEAARKCVHFSYLAYPYKRPGSVRMSPDRQTYFRDCMEKGGNVPEPAAPNPDPTSAEVRAPKT